VESLLEERLQLGALQTVQAQSGDGPQAIQDDMSKARSVNKDWEFDSKGTEISLGKFVPEYFAPLSLNLRTGVVSTEDTAEIWEAAREAAIEKVRGTENRSARTDPPMADEAEVEQSFWLSRPDGWVINRKMTAHSHSKGPWGPGDRSRVGGRGRSACSRATVG
jgi:hypothetical protein